MLIRSWSKEPCSYYFVAPKKLSLRKGAKGSAYCDHDASFLPRMYMDQSPRNLTGQSPRRIFEGWNTFWSQSPPGTNSSRKKNNRQQKNPKKKKSTSRMKPISNYVPALRIMQQDKTVANAPKTNQHEETATKWMGQAESLQKALQQNPFCAQICVDSSG